MTVFSRFKNNEALEARPRQDIGASAEKPAKDSQHYAFMPAAIEVEQTPSSKAGRVIIWLIVSMFVVAIAWASFGKLDIVAIAQGKVIPSDAVKQIQSLETARIEAIHVKEGQLVEQGHVLLELDASMVRAELNGLEAELAGTARNLARLSRLSEFLQAVSIQEQAASFVDYMDGLTTLQQSELLHEQAEVRAQLANFQNERATLRTEQGMALAEIIKKQQVIPVLKERVDALDTLQKKSYGSKLQYLELKQALIETRQDLAVQQERLKQLTHNEQGIATQQALYLADKHKRTLSQRNALQVQHDALAQRVIKAQQRVQHFTLVAPIRGQVQQLAVQTIDGVVQSAQVLMQLVPTQSELEVEAMIQNKDIGFVEEGQRVAVKVNTFNFTKYGMLDGTVTHISDDAVSEKGQGEYPDLVYGIRVKLNRETLNVDGRKVRLSPGMSVTAEIKTGQRRLIEFFLSPLLRYKQESLGER